MQSQISLIITPLIPGDAGLSGPTNQAPDAVNLLRRSRLRAWGLFAEFGFSRSPLAIGISAGTMNWRSFLVRHGLELGGIFVEGFLRGLDDENERASKMRK